MIKQRPIQIWQRNRWRTSWAHLEEVLLLDMARILHRDHITGHQPAPMPQLPVGGTTSRGLSQTLTCWKEHWWVDPRPPMISTPMIGMTTSLMKWPQITTWLP